MKNTHKPSPARRVNRKYSIKTLTAWDSDSEYVHLFMLGVISN